MSVDGERAAVVGAAIAKVALADGAASPSVVHVCRACLQLVGAVAVCAAVPGRDGLYEPLCAAGPVGAGLAELQAMVGEGPGMSTVAGDRPVLVTDLEATSIQQRWPLFAGSAAGLGTTTVFAFPLLVGAIAVGVLEIYWAERPSKGIAVTDGLLFADAALSALMTELAPAGSGADPAGTDEVGSDEAGTDEVGSDEAGTDEIGGRRRVEVGGAGEPFLDRWPQVHQATGMISAQSGIGLGEAYALLRAHAFATDQGLRAVAREVIERRLRLSPSKGPPENSA